MSSHRQPSRRARCRLRMCCLVLLPFVPLLAGAQTVYRCGPAGNSYSQLPCPEGRVVDVSDPRSPAQVKEARDAWREQERWAVRAARERRADEAAHPPAQAAGIGPAPLPRTRGDPSSRSERQPAKSVSPKRVKPGREPREGEFVAIAPGSAKKSRAQP
jgi:hypothetical protein